MKNEDKVFAMRHSLAHIMAAAVSHLYENVKFGVGPSVENGFYYDIDFGETKITDADLKKIDKEMRRIIGQKIEIVRSEMPIDDAVKWAKKAGQSYKTELLNDLKNRGTTAVAGDDIAENGVDEVSFYTIDDFVDLCRGPHVANTGAVGAFKLIRISGAYWRGDEKNPMMQRIYGAAFTTKEELNEYLVRMEEAKKRDHRRLGKELDLFTFSDLVGAGLPMFTPRGTVLRDEFAKYSVELRQKAGFQLVWTPHITKIDLYKKSGHYAKFGEGFMVEGQVSHDSFMMKPMNCPHHTQIFASKPRTYRELPIRYMEVTTDYRDEKTGELGGLSRVRSLTQDDSHVFCRHDQIEQEFKQIVAITQELYENIGMKLRARLSYRDDSDQYLGDAKLWEKSQKQIRKVADSNGLDYFEAEGEAAFYGPKIDFMALDALGREFQVSTVQLDFVQPERFGLEYIDDSGAAVCPVMIHYATLGSIERFLSIFIEHTAGKFPVWCAPEQLRLILVKNDDKNLTKFARDIYSQIKAAGIRVELDESNESVGKKIRNCENMKVPYAVVLGEKEVMGQKLPLRVRADLGGPEELTLSKLLEKIIDESKTRAR
ncbi:MAG: threonine--tRNA ligase [Candidatus Nomurabacteria bacterium]|nr:threonine--tRNA ligase [Candidatus Nomurabacteria bacterium]